MHIFLTSGYIFSKLVSCDPNGLLNPQDTYDCKDHATGCDKIS